MNSETPAVKPVGWPKRLGPTLSIVVAISLLVAVVLLSSKIRGLFSNNTTKTARPKPTVTLAGGMANTLRVDADAARRLGIRTAAAVPAAIANTLKLNGSLTFDANHLEEVRSRFNGEVIEVAKTADGRELKLGDRVKRGQLLAIVWSRELGDKKSELIDAISQQHLDTQTLKRLEELFQEGTIPERQYRDQQRAVENDRVAVSRLLRTLHTWRVEQEEIKDVEAEAQRLIAGQTKLSDDQAAKWARVEIRTALDGVILEHNVAVGDIVTSTDDLFKVADLSRFRVLAYAYEEDLPSLDRLPAEQRHWIISVPADPELAPQHGMIEQIGHIIDPMQHTALVMGWVENKDGRFRAGQFITATLELPPPGNEVVLPTSALIEKGGEKLVFVQTGDDPIFTRRHVSVSRQLGSQICFYIRPPSNHDQPTVSGIKPGERIVVSGAVELQQALTDLTASLQKQ